MKRPGKLRATEKAELISIAASTVMAAAMITVAFISHSVSILAEGTDTVMDIVASISVLLGIRISERRTRNFPTGLYKLENVIATCIGFLILYSAYELAREAISRMITGETKIDQPWLVVGVMVGVVVVTGMLAWYKAMVGKRENCPSLRADARHTMTDTVASFAVIIGVSLEAVGVKYADSVAALVVVAFLAIAGLGVVLDGLKVLLDASIEPDILDEARRIAVAEPGVREVLEVRGRNSGSYRFLHLVVVPASSDLKQAERSAARLSAAIKVSLDKIDNVEIEFSPERHGATTVGVPVEPDGRTVASDLGRAPFLQVLEVDADGSIVSADRSPNPSLEKEGGGDIYAAVGLSRMSIDAVVLKVEPRDSVATVLEASGIDVLVRPGVTDIDGALESVTAGVQRAR